MMNRFYYTFLFYALCASAEAQDTFSIVAADSATREVGSAGASCVDLFQAGFPDASFLGDLLPDTGAINTQASYLPTNQNNARTRMRTGDTPSQIISWLISNDAGGNPAVRQYGIVGFTGINVSASGHTGTNCLNYKNHITGSINGIYYCIQGNILLGQSILDSMEMRFRNAPGDLACRLMAALQGAKVVGADTRCASDGTSSLFAFLKVSQPGDAYGTPSFKIGVRTVDNSGIEPIDSLQTIFDQQHPCPTSSLNESAILPYFSIYPNPAENIITVLTEPGMKDQAYIVSDILGRKVVSGIISGRLNRMDISHLLPGMYFIQIGENRKGSFTKL